MCQQLTVGGVVSHDDGFAHRDHLEGLTRNHPAGFGAGSEMPAKADERILDLLGKPVNRYWRSQFHISQLIFLDILLDLFVVDPLANDPEFDPSPYNSSWDGLLNTSLLGIYHAGTFKKDIAEKQEFKGSIPYEFQEGKAYGILMVYWSKSDQSDLKYLSSRGFKDGDTFSTVIFPIRDENGNVVYKRL